MRLLVPAARAGEFPAAEVLVVAPAEVAVASGSVGSTGAPSPFHGRTSGPGLYVRLQGVDLPAEFAAAVEAGVDGVVLCGLGRPEEVEQAGARLAVAEAETGREDGTLRILPVVEQAAFALSLPAFRPLRRLAGIAVDPERLGASLHCASDAPPVTQAVAMTVLAARACGVEPVLVAPIASDEIVAGARRDGFGAILLR